MARYIDADKFEKEIKTEASESIADGVVRILDRQPTADVVEVVRCKDCNKTIGQSITGEKLCCVHEIAVPDNYYCASGERRTDNDL